MILVTITTNAHRERFDSFLIGTAFCDAKYEVFSNVPNIGVAPAMQKLYECHPNEDIIAYVHDDVTVYSHDWCKRVVAEFSDPKVAIVGFGGATGIGVPGIYKTRYEITQLQRINYASNMQDWETHGSYEAGSRDVAVVDGFFMAVRTSFLKEIGGWKWFPHNFHNYDNALCLMAHRHGYKVRMVGVECRHHGGGTSTSPEYAEWCRENGTTMEREHEAPHRWMYEEFRDLLPLRV
jgi:GT2 family glycosyltransferase